jgi:hypothetical protein
MPEAKPSPFVALFERIVLGMPLLVLLITIGIAGFFGYHTKDFELDASSDSITLENDKDLRYYNETRNIFGSDDFLVIPVTPPGELFAKDTLTALGGMVSELEALENVGSVNSILSVPLFHSNEGDNPNVPLVLLARGYKTLAGEGVDLERAREEMVSSPFYKNHLIAENGKTCAVQVNFAPAPDWYIEAYNRRIELRDIRREEGLTPEQEIEYEEVDADYRAEYMIRLDERAADIQKVREIIKKHEAIGEIHLGGVPMVMADIISYVRSDIFTFGIGVVFFMLATLTVIFRRPKWILLPTITCVGTVIIMMGYLGFTDWRTTIVTSNMSSILLVITLAMTIHIAVRYREAYAANPDASNRDLILDAVRHVARPCLYTVITTIVGFASLMVSGIRPVMDFGIMMTIGLSIAFLMCFTFFPAALYFTPKGRKPDVSYAELTNSPMNIFATFTERRGKVIALIAILLFVFGVSGAMQIEVENRFIDYFKRDTPIYEGMSLIDERLGGTTPLEVVLEGEGKDFWLEDENMAKLAEVHDHLDGLDTTGKVLSPISMIRILEKVNENKPVGKTMITVMRSQIPEDLARDVLKPYVSQDYDQVRIAMRMPESSHDLNRKELLAELDEYFEESVNTEIITARSTGVFVLYNNMLQSLVASQVYTIGAVFGVIWLTFLILFRSPYLATIAIIPNVLPVSTVLGTLGWLGIPLDMMTIMIAAITLGIAVDFAIHYIHRFREEFPKDRNYAAAMHRCHNSIGQAIYYTSVTIIIGFSILVLSNFYPTVYFGIFTGLAIFVALLASVTLLPLLLISWKPLGPESQE